jgi:DNA invertase Pin-like site-specific DNA recombinase
MRLVGYVRASTEDQLITLQHQARTIEQYCSVYGHELVCPIFTDQASGKNMDRPALRGALEAVQTVGVNGLIATKLDRVSRSVRDLHNLIDGPLKGRHLVLVKDNLDTSSPVGKFAFTMMAAVAELEREMIGERTSAALQEKKKQGKRWTNHAPYGYRWDGDRLKESTVEMATIGFMHDLRKKGWSWNQVMNSLNVSGYKTRTGGCWSKGTAFRCYQSFKRHSEDLP